jgi:transcription termination factor Rho
LLTPLGRGQRGLIVAPPAGGQDHFAEGNCESDSGKLSRDCSYPAAGGRAAGRSDDLQREIDCEIYHSNFDESVQRHVQVAEMVLERAKRLVEMKRDVVLLLDSLTRLSRGYNNLEPGKGPHHVGRRRSESAD